MTSRTLVGFALCQGGALLTCMLLAACAAPSALAAKPESDAGSSAGVQQCPAAELDEFLKSFASPQAAALRGQFTRDPLQYETPAGVVEEKGAARLDRFNYRFLPQFNLYVPEDVSNNPESLEGMRRGEFVAPVSIEAQPEGRYRVTFGMEYEADSYMFQRHEGCWELLRAINLRD